MVNPIERHREKIVGVLSCFERLVVQGTLPSVASRLSRSGGDGARHRGQILGVLSCFDRVVIRRNATESKGYRKEDRIREIIAKRGTHP